MSRHSLLRCTLSLSLALGALTTARQARGEETRRAARVAVVDVKAIGSCDPKSVAPLSALVSSEAARLPVKVVAGSDLQALLGFEKQKALLGCSDNSCLAEIGGALGVDYLLTSEVGEVGGRWLLSLALLDVKRGAAVARLTKKAKSQADLVEVVGEAVEELFKAIPAGKLATKREAAPEKTEPAKAAAGAQPTPTAAKAEATAPPVEPAPAAQVTPRVTATSPSPGSSARTAGFALLGGGAALAIGGAVSGVLALTEKSAALQDKQNGVPLSTLQADANKIKTEAMVADVLYAAGIVAGAVGLVLVLTSSSSSGQPPAASAQVGLAPIAGGGAVILSGGF
ncbi:MAG: hypothetical protein QM765_22530 [Myxococcales bacterium]